MELLVVIAIIGVLVALLLPAIQAAREAARRTQCANQLRQLAIGWLNHEDSHGHLPTGGYGFRSVGDADRGFGKRQTGGWVFNILPYIEQQQVRDLGAGLPAAEKARVHAERESIAIPSLNCPTRRPAQPYALGKRFYVTVIDGQPHIESSLIQSQARTDYAANYGNVVEMIAPGQFEFRNPNLMVSSYLPGDPVTGPSPLEELTGVSHIRSQVRLAQIQDGLSNTYMLGEKVINSDNYFDGQDLGDDWSMYTGQQDDTYRLPVDSPIPDSPFALDENRFGSAHPTGMHFAFCDGSVHFLSYDIDLLTHQKLGNREDGMVIDSANVGF